MRKTLAIAAAAVLIPSAALAEEKEKPGVVDSLGAAVGGALGYTAGAAGGPLGSAVGGLAGQSIGKGLVGGVKKLFGMDKKEESAKGPGPATLAEVAPPPAAASAPAGNAPATLADLEATGGPPTAPASATSAGEPAAAQAEAIGAELLPAPDPATLDAAPPEAVPEPGPGPGPAP